MSNKKEPLTKDVWYLIWSNEHGAWWMPDNDGYTTDIDDAGRYSKNEANRVVLNSMMYGPKFDGQYTEVAVVAPREWN